MKNTGLTLSPWLGDKEAASLRGSSTNSALSVKADKNQKYRDIRDIFSQPFSTTKEPLHVNTHHGGADLASRPPKSPLRPRTPGSVRSLRACSNKSSVRSYRRPSVPTLPTHTSSDSATSFPRCHQHKYGSISSTTSSVFTNSSSNASVAPNTPSTLGSISEKKGKGHYADVKSVLMNETGTNTPTIIVSRKSMSAATTTFVSRLEEYQHEEESTSFGGKIKFKDDNNKVITTYVSLVN